MVLHQTCEFLHEAETKSLDTRCKGKLPLAGTSIFAGLVALLYGTDATIVLSLQARAVFSDLAGEVCREEAEEVVSETMAPLQDRLVQIRREKDVAAVQV